MESLVAQPGAPILTFGKQSRGKVAVSQKRFYLSPNIQPDPEQKWTLPVCFKIKMSDKLDFNNSVCHIKYEHPSIVECALVSQECQVLKSADMTLKTPSGALFFANAGGKGYYRSAYTPSAYASVVAQVETKLTPAERISLIGDQWAQVRSNKVPIGAYLDLVAAVKTDSGAEVLSEATSGVRAAYARVASTTDERDTLASWIRSTFAPEYAKLGLPAGADSSNTRELRAELFGLLGYYGKDPTVLAQAREIAANYLSNPDSVDSTLGQTALSIAARNGDAALFDQIQKIAETSTNPEFQEGALRVLAEFEDPALVQRSLYYATSGKVRNQDAVIQFAIALQIDENRAQAWKYIQNSWEKVQAQLTIEMGAILVGATGNFCSAEDRASVEQFFSTHKVASSDKALKHAIERIDGCIELRALQEPNLKQWLAARSKP
jgi:aminopeptidase N/puromycin-sensitive aminopeptidase